MAGFWFGIVVGRRVGWVRVAVSGIVVPGSKK